MAFVLAETEVQEPDESLAAEVAPFGVDTILVEPGIARTATAEGVVLLPAGVARRARGHLERDDRRVAVGERLGVRGRGAGGDRERQQQAEGRQQARRDRQMVPLAARRGRTADPSSSWVKAPVAPSPTAKR
jgi:hypothetical protein